MCADDVATQAELNAAIAAEAASRVAGDVKLVGDVVQVVHAQTGAVATTTTVMPFDDTIPQITEGAEFLTRTITPSSATSKLRIDVVFNGSCSTTSYITVGIFRDSTANALAAASKYGVNGSYEQVVLSCLVDAGSTSATTFRVRAGQHTGGTLTMNGDGGARRLGGAMATTITVTEIKA
jgi:hypothetical protein